MTRTEVLEKSQNDLAHNLIKLNNSINKQLPKSKRRLDQVSMRKKTMKRKQSISGIFPLKVLRYPLLSEGRLKNVMLQFPL